MCSGPRRDRIVSPDSPLYIFPVLPSASLPPLPLLLLFFLLLHYTSVFYLNLKINVGRFLVVALLCACMWSLLLSLNVSHYFPKFRLVYLCLFPSFVFSHTIKLLCPLLSFNAIVLSYIWNRCPYLPPFILSFLPLIFSINHAPFHHLSLMPFSPSPLQLSRPLRRGRRDKPQQFNEQLPLQLLDDKLQDLLTFLRGCCFCGRLRRGRRCGLHRCWCRCSGGF